MSQSHELPPPYTKQDVRDKWTALALRSAYASASNPSPELFHESWVANKEQWGFALDFASRGLNEAQQAERNFHLPIHEAKDKRITELEAALIEIRDLKATGLADCDENYTYSEGVKDGYSTASRIARIALKGGQP